MLIYEIIYYIYWESISFLNYDKLWLKDFPLSYIFILSNNGKIMVLLFGLRHENNVEVKILQKWQNKCVHNSISVVPDLEFLRHLVVHVEKA